MGTCFCYGILSCEVSNIEIAIIQNLFWKIKIFMFADLSFIGLTKDFAVHTMQRKYFPQISGKTCQINNCTTHNF